MFFVDDLSVVFIAQRILTELLFYLMPDSIYQLILYGAVAVDIIWSDTGLAAV